MLHGAAVLQTNAASMSSTDQGGGKRRVDICGESQKARFRVGHHRMHDSLVGLCRRWEMWGDHHEDAASGYRFHDWDDFCLSSVRASVLPEWHLARSLQRLRRL